MTIVETLMIAAHIETAAKAERELHDALAAARADAERQGRLAADAQRRHREDVELIGEKLLKEAEDRGWCKEFDEVIGALNAGLHIELATRDRDFTVTATVELRLTVTAVSEDDARDQAADLVRDAERELDDMDSITAYPEGRGSFRVETDD
ncbi:hypothetical protein [Paractinoplanes rishiriensis]|uniref:Uncharacterized protein n=1 Tax=Paractinoplanes rishiriensis TaxID=1050105 RepID=A0A919K828_9ACTN|nr:hypothetical protein [Actinoplanes rishiriensis]GIF01088.1 hypothetical protein Ari01nite_85520 [Actinoplanes rishiriensis]